MAVPCDAEGKAALGHLRAAARAAGAAVSEVRIEATLMDGSGVSGTIHADRLGAWILISSAASENEVPDGSSDELLLRLLATLMATWGLTHRQLAAALGCASDVLALWLSVPGRFRLPRTIEVRMHRLVAVDRLRLAGEVSDQAVRAWLDAARSDLEGRSVAECLLSRDGDGFAAVLAWLCLPPQLVEQGADRSSLH